MCSGTVTSHMSGWAGPLLDSAHAQLRTMAPHRDATSVIGVCASPDPDSKMDAMPNVLPPCNALVHGKELSIIVEKPYC